MEEDDDAPAAADDTAAVGDENEDNEETTKIGNKSFMLHILDLLTPAVNPMVESATEVSGG
jgi:hypothetical protein